MFGVTLWEMFSGGEEPWARLSPYLILQRLEQDRARLPRPPLCSRALYALALRCWAPHPADRPSFSNLEGLLQEVGAPASPRTHRLISPFFAPFPCTGLTYSWAGVWEGSIESGSICRMLRALGRHLGYTDAG